MARSLYFSFYLFLSLDFEFGKLKNIFYLKSIFCEKRLFLRVFLFSHI